MPGVRETGKVKFFNDEKGFGFIVPDGAGDEIFVHRRDLARSLPTLIQNQRVSYELVDNPRRAGEKKAANVELL